MHNTFIEAVLLDLDGLLLDSEQLSFNSMVAAFKAHQMDVPEGLLLSLVGKPAQVSWGLYKAFMQDSPSATAIWELSDHYYEHWVATGKLQLKPGVEALFDFLTAHSIPWAIATSSRQEEAHVKLQATGILGRIQNLITLSHVQRPKPAPDLFLLAAQELNVQDPKSCVVLEDSEPGIQAAHAAGMLPIMIPDLIQPSEALLPIIHTVLPSLEAFIAHFQNHFVHKPTDYKASKAS